MSHLRLMVPAWRVALAACAISSSGWLASAATAAPRQMEFLQRGVVAVVQPGGDVWVSWRLLGTDPEGTAFNVYREAPGGAVRLNDTPLSGPTHFVDTKANAATGGAYFVRPVLAGKEYGPSARFTVAAGAPAQPYLAVPIQTPEGYSPNDASVGDLDGDGDYEIVLKQEGRAKDNSQKGETDPVLLQAYELDGTLLWTINLGKNIRGGAHYTQFMVYDLDGDGRAEIACKTADGTTDGAGKVIGDTAADHRNEGGYILRGPEFFTIFDGRTGAALATTDYLPGRHPTKQDPTGDELKELWGDGYGNRMDRFLAGVAYLDGERPSVVMCRGYYTRTALVAWDWRDGKLTRRWVFDVPSRDPFAGQGNHQLSVADVDADGRDEIVYGAMVIDDDGKGLYTTGWGHGDALHVSDLDPTKPGLEVFTIQERFGAEGMSFRHAATGKPYWTVPSTKPASAGGDKGEGPGRGVSFDIDPTQPGNETWAAGAGMSGMYSAAGERFSEKRPRSVNFAVWWDGDLLRELLDRTTIAKWNWRDATETVLVSAEGCRSNNGTKATPTLSADLLGDWREEVIWPTADGKELRVYTTTIPTEHRLVTLMHDPQYRLAIAWQNVAYNQPPHPGFFLGHDMKAPPKPAIRVVAAPAAK